MGNKPFNVVVVLFWLATMSWLVVAKVLPPLRVGEPPNYASILEQSSDESPSCWKIAMRGHSIGWAANKIVRRPDGISELYSRVYLGALPLDELAPGWLAGVLKDVVRDLRHMDLDKRSRFAVDPLGRLVEFESRVRLADEPEAIKVQGQIDGTTLYMTVQSGEVSVPLSRTLSPNSLVGDELSPQARMPGLRVGQTWTVPLYSPFRAASTPLEILQAIVEREDAFHWDGREVNTRVVIYRGDSGSGPGGGETRGRMWVRDDGLVLRQEVAVFRSPLVFDRLSDAEARAIADALGSDWTQAIDRQVARALLDRLSGGGVGDEWDESSDNTP